MKRILAIAAIVVVAGCDVEPKAAPELRRPDNPVLDAPVVKAEKSKIGG